MEQEYGNMSLNTYTDELIRACPYSIARAHRHLCMLDDNFCEPEGCNSETMGGRRKLKAKREERIIDTTSL